MMTLILSPLRKAAGWALAGARELPPRLTLPALLLLPLLRLLRAGLVRLAAWTSGQPA